MHVFHDYISKQLHEHLKTRRIVVWYDPNNEFVPYIEELLANTPAPDTSTAISSTPPTTHCSLFNGLYIDLVRFAGSFFEVRATVEPLVAGDQPGPLLIYLPGMDRDRTSSVLMELEKAGICYEPQLKRLARNVLRESYTDGIIDEMLAPENVTYADIVGFLAQNAGGEQASMLKVIFAGCPDSTVLLATWLADDTQDTAILSKEATAELFKLIDTRLGLELRQGTPLSEARAKTVRYVLVNEFRSDLRCDPPISVNMILPTPSKDHLHRTREVAAKLRKEHPDAYTMLADQAESELGLHAAGLKTADLGSVDTFRFEEQLLLTYCGELIAAREYARAMEIVSGRAQCFWVERDVARQAQWEACRLMTELGVQIEAIRLSLRKMGTNPAAWVQSYTAQDGWYQADLTHRNLEAWVAKMDDEPQAEQALGVVRREYEELLKKMTEGFSHAYQLASWTIPSVLHQTRIYPEVVQPGSGRVAYFFVDAMRYEMGVELARQLQEAHDLTLRPAVAALPTITPVGMAALLPGASSSFSVVEHNGKLAARIAGSPLPDVPTRLKFLKTQVPDAVELTLGKLLETSSARLRKTIGEAPLVVVRSQEIDRLGEGGDDLLARQLMDTVIGNLARGVRKLANLGIERFVIAADHGFQFSLKKDEDMRTDPPGGDTVEIHRRCWIGHGGKTPPGTVRVTGAELGYDTNLDFIFPTGLGVFRTSGGLSFHHGSISLQELLVPMISLRFPARAEKQRPKIQVQLVGCPDRLTNRTFGVGVFISPDLYAKDPIPLRLILVAAGEQVGQAGMAIKAELDRTSGIVRVIPGTEASIGLMLMREDCRTIRIVAQDPVTDAVLVQSDEIPVKLGI